MADKGLGRLGTSGAVWHGLPSVAGSEGVAVEVGEGLITVNRISNLSTVFSDYTASTSKTFDPCRKNKSSRLPAYVARSRRMSYVLERFQNNLSWALCFRISSTCGRNFANVGLFWRSLNLFYKTWTLVLSYMFIANGQ